VENNYYELLVAERQLAIAKANVESFQSKQLLATNAAGPGELPGHQEEQIETGKALVMADSKVKELMVSLNSLLGFPEETELELVPPVMQFEEISLREATDNAMAANPEVVEAEQTVVKARAASKLSKLDYVPDFELLGGYVYQDNMLPPLPRDFSFIGVMGSYNLFDFGKREHTVKERSAQLSAAELALQLTKAKVAANVKSSYFELDRSRQLSELVHRLASAVQIQQAGYSQDHPDAGLSRAKLELEMFQADLQCRQAFAQLKTLMGER
jgi:outer membrane protein TolC